MYKKQKAFTATELLIVLMVIGFLAVFSINSMTGALPDRNKLLFKKAYSVVEKTVQELANDETLYPYNPNKLGFINDVEVIIPGGDGTKTAKGDDKFVTLFKDRLNLVEDDDAVEIIDGNTYDKFRTSDGLYWYVQKKGFQRGNSDQFDRGVEIRVDVNGPEKDPNKRASESEETKKDPASDIFRMYVLFDGKIKIRNEDTVEQEFLMSQSLKRDEE